MSVASLRSPLPLSGARSWVSVAPLRSAVSLGNTYVWVRVAPLKSTLSLSLDHSWVSVAPFRIDLSLGNNYLGLGECSVPWEEWGVSVSPPRPPPSNVWTPGDPKRGNRCGQASEKEQIQGGMNIAVVSAIQILAHYELPVPRPPCLHRHRGVPGFHGSKNKQTASNLNQNEDG